MQNSKLKMLSKLFIFVFILLLLATSALYFYLQKNKNAESFMVCYAPKQCKTINGAPAEAVLKNVVGYPSDHHRANSYYNTDPSADFAKGRFDEKAFYFSYKNKVYYFINAKILTGFSEDAGELSGSDAKTFEIIDANFSKDKKQVYGRENMEIKIANKIIVGADPKTFTPLDFPFAIDKNNVYYLNQKIENADPKSFVMQENKKCGRDRSAFYKDGMVSSEDSCK